MGLNEWVDERAGGCGGTATNAQQLKTASMKNKLSLDFDRWSFKTLITLPLNSPTNASPHKTLQT
jgi:hypothetical protein